MAAKRDFDINIIQLSTGQHDFHYTIDRSFFDLFEDPLVQEGTFEVNVELEKKPNSIELYFQIDGETPLVCDRSLDKFRYPIHLREDLHYKYGEEEAELSEDLFVITSETQQINVADHIYEFIAMSIPMKKLHPRYDFEEETEEDEIVYTSEEEGIQESNEENIDPRWQALKKLKDKK